MIPAALVPPTYKWCVAGGYAACPALARDIDVWVYGIDDHALEAVQAAFQLRMKEQFGYAFVESSERRSSTSYSQEFITILKVGVLHWGNKPHHIIVTDAKSVDSILDGFDVSTHAVAIMPDGAVVRHPLWTPPNEKPEVLRETPNTPGRMVRIGARFGHVVEYRANTTPAYDNDRDPADEDDDCPF